MIVKCWPQMSHNFGSLQLKFGGLKLLVVKDNLSCPELAPFGVPRNYFASSIENRKKVYYNSQDGGF